MSPGKKRIFTILFLLMLAPLVGLPSAGGQAPAQPQQPPLPPPVPPPPMPGEQPRRPVEPPVIKKLGDSLVQINNITVDTRKREVSVSGKMLSDRTLEFIASAKDGMKLYESAIELETDATTFNFALIMIGLDRSNAVVPETHFGPRAGGDPVEIWIEWGSDTPRHRMRVEEMLHDLESNRVPKMGEWVYTGSMVLPDGRFLAEMEGVIIGFVHSPASLIENAVGTGIGAYGSIRLNPSLKIAPDTELKLTVKALPKKQD